MAWLFTHNGNLYHRASDAEPWVHRSVGTSGKEGGINNTLWEREVGLGPLPRGTYTLEALDDKRFGPVVFRLRPDPMNTMYGRSGFLIHWAQAGAEELSSEGCIVLYYWKIFLEIADDLKRGDATLYVQGIEPRREDAPGMKVPS